MASATTSGGWSTASPYLGANAMPKAKQAAVTQDGNAVLPGGIDIAAQLGQALSAYHTHQASATPAVNSQGYGAEAANQNSMELGQAMQASNSATPAVAGYAAPGMSRLGIAVLPKTSGVSTVQGMLTGRAGSVNPAPTTGNTAQSPYIQYMASNGGMAYARYDAATNQYVTVDPSFLNFDKTYGAGGQTANSYKGQDANGQAIYGLPNQFYLTDGSTSAYQDLTGQGKTFSLNAYNTQLSAAAAAQKAQLAGLAQGSNAARTAAQNTDTTATTAASVNSNQDFINQLGSQLNDINTAPGVQAADQTSANTQSAINSQLSTSSYQSGDLGAAARYGAGSAVSAEGAGALSHEQAAANAFDATFAQMGQAASQQLGVADAETQQQASADVQSIADEIANLQAQLGQLDATTANQVNQHLAALQDQISAYQNGVASYTGTAQANANDFKAILSAAAQVGAIVAMA